MRFLKMTSDAAAVVAELRGVAALPDGLESTVAAIVGDVRAHGDDAVRAHVARLDGVDLPAEYAIPADELRRALDETPSGLRAALETAAANIRAYHEREMPHAWREKLPQGQVVGQEIVPLATAGLYVPGGLANYPSSVLMTAIPAQVAGVERVVVCSPPRRGGGVASGVAAAAALLGVGDVLPIGGAQAVAAMAYGTAVVPRCDVIVGPGNAWVTEAKRQVMGHTRIDSLAGPSEVLIVADAGGEPEWLAADLLAQAEHGAGAMAALLDVGGELAQPVAAAVERLAAELGSADAGRQPRDGRLRRSSMRRSRSSMRSRPSISNCISKTPPTSCRGSATPARSSSAPTPRRRSATTRPAPTTCCPPAARRASARGCRSSISKSGSVW